MYTVINFATKRQLIEAVKRGEEVLIFAPGLGEPKRNGTEFISGPHFPEPHKWYATVKMKDGLVIKVE